MTVPLLRATLTSAGSRIRRLLRSIRGAFDLPSIIVGIVVVGILASGVLAAVFAVIPFAQDNAAKQDLYSVRTAEGVAITKDDRFMSATGLDIAGYLEVPGKVAVGSDLNGTCYVSMSLSGTGKIFYATSTVSDPALLTSGTDTGCLSPAEQTALAESLGATPVAAEPAVVPAIAATWGKNMWGQLGNDSSIDSKAAVHVSTSGLLQGKKVDAITAGYDHTCAVASGGAYCWGTNVLGKLGNGTTTNASVPVAVEGLLKGKTVTAIDGSEYHTCAIANSSAYCWGGNSDGKLGDGSRTSSKTPVLVGGLLAGKTVTAIATSNYVTCAIADGAAYCWGNNVYGKLGDSSETNSLVPVPVNAAGVLKGKTVTAISTGKGHTCAIADGAAFCWGQGESGRLGDGKTTDSVVPVAVDTSGFLAGKSVSSINSGNNHSCVTADGAVYCWGVGSFGQLGSGSTAGSSIPSPVQGLLAGKKATSVTAGEDFSCAVAGTAAYCWGYNNFGQIGNLTATNSVVPVAVNTDGILAGKKIAAVAGGLYHTAVLYAE